MEKERERERNKKKKKLRDHFARPLIIAISNYFDISTNQSLRSSTDRRFKHSHNIVNQSYCVDG